MAKKSDSILNKAYRWQVFLLVCLLFFATYLALIPLPILDNALGHGFAHPLEGWDHIVTMIAVGIWAAQLRGHAVWLLPLVFVSVMSLGGIAGAAGILLPAVESIILMSCAVFSLFIIRRIKFSSRINLAVVAFFAFFHGFAHGHEISASASLLSYTVGFMLATLLLHGAGIFAAKLVLFCLTCFLATLLPNLAQASQLQSIIKSNGILNPVMRMAHIDQNSPWHQTIRHHYSASERYVVDDFNVTFLNLCVLIPGNPDPANPTLKQRKQLTNPAHLSKTERLDNVSGMLSLINNTNLAALTGLPPHFALISQDTRPNFAADFKHYFPDINYTPGQVLLSNGTGATSPPLAPALTARFRIPSGQPYLAYLISSFEDHALQPIFTVSLKGFFALQSPSIAKHFNCVVALTDNAHTSFRRNYRAACTLKGRGCKYDEVLHLYHST